MVGAWELAGVDSTNYIQDVCARYQEGAARGGKHLQIWEQRRMCMKDKRSAKVEWG